MIKKIFMAVILVVCLDCGISFSQVWQMREGSSLECQGTWTQTVTGNCEHCGTFFVQMTCPTSGYDTYNAIVSLTSTNYYSVERINDAHGASCSYHFSIENGATINGSGNCVGNSKLLYLQGAILDDQLTQ